MAKYVIARSASLYPYAGEECEVLVVGPIPAGSWVSGGITAVDADYLVKFSDGYHAAPLDWQLQKLNPPDEPREMIEHLEEETT